MPKQLSGDLHQFKTEELYEMLGHQPFGTLLSEEQVKVLKANNKADVIEDYVRYKMHVFGGYIVK